MGAATNKLERLAADAMLVYTSLQVVAGTDSLTSVSPGPATTAAGKAIVLIDLDNGGRAQGDGYLHDPRATGVQLLSYRNLMAQLSPAADPDTSFRAWAPNLGVVRAIDGTKATIQHYCYGGGGGFTTIPLTVHHEHYYPAVIDYSLDASGKSLKNRGGTVLATKYFSSINTGVTLKDAFENDVTPAVGDLIFFAIDELTHLGVPSADAIPSGSSLIVSAGYQYTVTTARRR